MTHPPFPFENENMYSVKSHENANMSKVTIILMQT